MLAELAKVPLRCYGKRASEANFNRFYNSTYQNSEHIIRSNDQQGDNYITELVSRPFHQSCNQIVPQNLNQSVESFNRIGETSLHNSDDEIKCKTKGNSIRSS